jgi:hypothetical protein
VVHGGAMRVRVGMMVGQGVCAAGVRNRLGGLARKATSRGQGESPLAVLLCFPIGEAGRAGGRG